jgi:diaminohydroxyphosphoribosylaminopyrimidine deaminase / 5-amino-6-(5-phosphoribosylamino)uracil reductase
MTEFSTQDFDYMNRALTLASQGRGSVSPNPQVGCVLVKDNNIIGEGWHQQAGLAHAEINALQQAGQNAKNCRVYVTLEPCAHFGRTAPCAEALIDAGVTEVIVAMLDPNPLVAGKGIERLKQSGIRVIVGLLAQQAEQMNKEFIHSMRVQRPFMRCKMAMSLDGRTAMNNGDSAWITSTSARKDVHALRADSDVVLTGIGTILQDDPQMNVRQVSCFKQPDHVILDSSLQLPLQAKILQLKQKIIVLTSKKAMRDSIKRVDALTNLGAQVKAIETNDSGQLNLLSVLNYLHTLDIRCVLLEAGATLSGAMIEQRLVDELVVYMAPVLMGNEARALFNLPIFDMDQRIKLSIQEIRQVGVDWRLTATLDNS